MSNIPIIANSAEPAYLIPRDISWLSFNYRVLQEAKDPTVPLFERLKFLAIYSSNLDEFFRVRVAHHRNLLRLRKKDKKKLDYNPADILRRITSIVNKQQEEFSKIFEQQIVFELKRHNIRLLRRLELDDAQKDFVESYFEEYLLPFVQPVLLIENKIRPFLNNAALYLFVHLREKETDNNHDAKQYYALLKVPSDHLPRFIRLPGISGRYDIIILDDIVRHSISTLFPGFHILETYSVKLTRDAELYIDDEFSGNLVEKIKDSLNKRNVGPPSRLVYDREMPLRILKYLMDTFELSKADLLPEGRYHNNFDFFDFPDFDMIHLKNPPMPPLRVFKLEQAKSIFSVVSESDVLLHFPYQTFEYVVKMFEEAAADPGITHIKVVQYRVAQKSRIMQALIEAVDAGKQVTVFVEVKARFDEEANLIWAEKLEEAGVRVLYSFPGLKVHSKLALFIRQEADEIKSYAYLSTGNFNEKTALIYSDFGFMTASRALTAEVSRVFHFLETTIVPEKPFEHLMVGQFNLRSGIESLIDFEIAEAKAGRKALCVIKANSLEDPQMIDKLRAAGMAGVEVRLIIRGICCLIPGIKGFSENIKAMSIVDKFLEHSRIYYFYHRGNEKIYLSSADFMRRNLSYRIEAAFPVYDPEYRKEIIDFLHIQWNDNIKARWLNSGQINKYKREGPDMGIRAQIETYFYLKRREETFARKEAEHATDEETEIQEESNSYS